MFMYMHRKGAWVGDLVILKYDWLSSSVRCRTLVWFNCCVELLAQLAVQLVGHNRQIKNATTGI